jgi:toxin-antitoxin system PIN domain toxin
MLLIDANLLLYAYVETSPEHERAKSWLESTLNGDKRLAFPWMTLLAFLRLSTNRHVNPNGPSLNIAVAQMNRWLSSPQAWIPEPGRNHQSTLARLLVLPGISSKDVTDAYLAALAIDHGLILCSADVGFARFPGLRWQNPLA